MNLSMKNDSISQHVASSTINDVLSLCTEKLLLKKINLYNKFWLFSQLQQYLTINDIFKNKILLGSINEDKNPSTYINLNNVIKVLKENKEKQNQSIEQKSENQINIQDFPEIKKDVFLRKRSRREVRKRTGIIGFEQPIQIKVIKKKPGKIKKLEEEQKQKGGLDYGYINPIVIEGNVQEKQVLKPKQKIDQKNTFNVNFNLISLLSNQGGKNKCENLLKDEKKQLQKKKLFLKGKRVKSQIKINEPDQNHRKRNFTIYSKLMGHIATPQKQNKTNTIFCFSKKQDRNPENCLKKKKTLKL